MSDDEFDFIIVGGGSSGCALAGKLASRHPDARILLLEAGDSSERHPETLRSDGYGQAFANDRLMWPRYSLPQSGCGGRRLFLGTGRGIGGSSAVNAMVYLRGARDDFSAWGVPGWTWDDVEPVFADIEESLRLSRHPPSRFGEACIEAACHVGFGRSEDLNDGDWERKLGYEWMNFDGAHRRNSYVAFLKPIRHERPKLEVKTGVSVSHIEFDEKRHAVAVRYGDGRGHWRARSRGEIIMCAGALETPRILLQSGVGPAKELREIGVPVVHDAPEVGRNLQDHPNATLFFRSRHNIDAICPQVYGFGRMSPSADTGNGPDTCFVMYPARSSLACAMERMLPALMVPGTEDPEYPQWRGRLRRRIKSGVHRAFALESTRQFVEKIWGIVVILGKPQSRGRVWLARDQRAREPSRAVDPNYFGDPRDLETMLSGLRQARAMSRAPTLSDLGSREWFPGGLGSTRKGLVNWLRANAMTTYHFCGTCRMGDDPRSVVDSRLRVRGVGGLRVADASIMPVVPVGALNAPSMMIGVRAAQFLTEDYER